MKSQRDNLRRGNNRDKSFNQQDIARDRIKKLFEQAEISFKEHPELSRRYVVLARKLSTRYKTKFSQNQKRLFCKKCNAYLKNGMNSMIRLTHGKIVHTCLECKDVKRMVYKKWFFLSRICHFQDLSFRYILSCSMLFFLQYTFLL